MRKQEVKEYLATLNHEDLYEMLNWQQTRYIYFEVLAETVAADTVARIHDAHSELAVGYTDEDLMEEYGVEVGKLYAKEQKQDSNNDYYSNIDGLIYRVIESKKKPAEMQCQALLDLVNTDDKSEKEACDGKNN
ncbi:MAG: hypothetical protein E7272_07555 [Pseudobutyrivibrio ruminis]|uniref:Uncharacterized protein n=1 Tax=Pseudobutyrivibrio ruminis TaxID=46206 RepID=A0A927U9N8_9FIRM|nr:hypothetical protein [Pseudobutyrivibrio ruminis]